MATTNLGTVAIHGEGEWSVENAYAKLSVVAYNGGSYMSLQAVPAGTALTDTAYWMPISDTRETFLQALEQHPEWVTTVQDGSITAEKLTAALAAAVGKIPGIDGRLDSTSMLVDSNTTSIGVLDSRVEAIETGATHDGDEIVGVRTGMNGTLYASAGGAVRGQVSNLARDIDMISDPTSNLFDWRKIQIKNWTMTTSGVIASSVSGRCFVMPVTADFGAAVTIHIGALNHKLTLATFGEEPVVGENTPLSYVANGSESTGKTLTLTIPDGAVYLVGFFYATSDTIGVDEMLSTIMLESGNAYTGYVPPLKPKTDPKISQDIIDIRADLAGTVKTTSQALTLAEQRAARDNISAVDRKTVYDYNAYDVFKIAPSESKTHNGVTYTKNADGRWTVNGTATARSFANLARFDSGFPEFMPKNRSYYLNMNGGHVPVRVYEYADGGIISTRNFYASGIIKFDASADGAIIRLNLEAGESANETVNYELIPIVGNIPSADGTLAAVDTESEDESGKTDMAPAIIAVLAETGHCRLGPGIYYVSGNIDMPPHSTLEGCGDSTIIRLLQSVSSGYVIKPTQFCTVKNLCISGGVSEPSFSSGAGDRIGINWFANSDESESPQDPVYHSIVDGVFIRNFNGCGIRCHNTGLNYRNSLYAANSMIHGCYYGIDIDYRSEFNKFCNIGIYWCQIACRNNSGNNMFDNMTFHAFATGLLIESSYNNSHGSVTNGTFCHIGSNAGKAIWLKSAINGFVFTGCQIHFCSIDVEDSNGIVFNGCEFGRGTGAGGATINISGGNLVMFNGCVFNNDVSYPPDITVTGNTKTKFVGCFGAVSGNEVTV